jgi:hypothetical protein
METITIGNTTITAEDIVVVGVNYEYKHDSDQYLHSVEIQTSRTFINEQGVVEIIHKNHTYPCSKKEYVEFYNKLW